MWIWIGNMWGDACHIRIRNQKVDECDKNCYVDMAMGGLALTPIAIAANICGEWMQTSTFLNNTSPFAATINSQQAN